MPGMGFGFGFGFHRRASGSGASASATLLTLATAAGAEAVYNPDDENTWTLRDDGSDLWYSAISDGLGNRGDMAQATAANQPKQITLSNGRRAMFLDESADATISRSLSPEITQPNTVLIVGRSLMVTDVGRWLDAGGTGRQIIGVDAVSGSGWAMWAGTWLSTASPAADTDWTILQGNYNGASSELFRNGTSIASGEAGSNALGAVRTATNGITAGHDRELGPIIVFTGLKTNAELSDIRDHLNANWPIGATG